MLFNSHEFIFAYLPLVFAVFFLLSRFNHRLSALWLALASLFFYGWWNPKFLFLLLGSIVFNYAVGYAIGHGRKKSVLVGGVVANLVLLGVFKYANFFVSTIDAAGARLPLLDIVLPAGISFFTFTQIAFLVDTYRGIAREYDFVHYLLFVTWFPHLIAGPVIHHKQMMPQFGNPATYKPNLQSISVGLTIFAVGLFKKVMLADEFAIFANPVFNSTAAGTSPMLGAAWLGALAYTLQLYFDFSGYSDMAIGLSRIFNIKLPLNFDSPYKSANIIEFWRRWHMTLSTFLRDYLYFPLGGNRKGPVRRHLNLMATMLLGGLWHGAGWTFVLWGGLHGLYLVLNHLWRSMTGASERAHAGFRHGLGVLLTFGVVVIAWVPFRSTSLAATIRLWRGMLGLNGLSLPPALEARLPSLAGHGVRFDGLLPDLQVNTTEGLAFMSIGLFIVWAFPNTQQWLAACEPAYDAVVSPYRLRWRFNKFSGLLTGALLGTSILLIAKTSEFLYFQF